MTLLSHPTTGVFVQNPVSFNPLPFVAGFQGAAECIQFNPEAPTKIIVIPRNGQGKVQFFETDPCFVFHHANAFEKDGQLILDSICYNEFPDIGDAKDYSEVDFDHVPASQLWRFTIDLATAKVDVTVPIERYCEFPTIHPGNVGQEYRYLYIGIAHGPNGQRATTRTDKTRHANRGRTNLERRTERGLAGSRYLSPNLTELPKMTAGCCYGCTMQ